MDPATAQERFRESDRLFRDKQYDAALRILDQLDALYPNTPNVRFAKAKCYAALGRTQQAVDVCDELLREHNHPRAAELKQKLLEPAALVIPEIDLDFKPSFSQPPPLPQGVGFDTRWIYGGLAALVVIALLVLPLVLSDGDTDSSENAVGEAAADVESGEEVSEQDLQEIAERLGPGAYLVGFLFMWFMTFWLLFFALSVLGKLPGATFLENAMDVAVWSLLVSLVNFIPFVGFIVGLVIISQHYDLSCGELAIFVLIHVAIGIVLAIIAAVLLFAMIVPMLENYPTITLAMC